MIAVNLNAFERNQNVKANEGEKEWKKRTY